MTLDPITDNRTDDYCCDEAAFASAPTAAEDFDIFKCLESKICCNIQYYVAYSDQIIVYL